MVKTLKLICAFMLFIITLLVGLMLSVKLFNGASHWHGFNDFLHQYAVGVTLWRYALMVLFIVFYPSVIRRLYQRKTIPKPRLEKLSQRWIAVAICLFYEAVIVHNVLGIVVDFIQRVF